MLLKQRLSLILCLFLSFSSFLLAQVPCEYNDVTLGHQLAKLVDESDANAEEKHTVIVTFTDEAAAAGREMLKENGATFVGPNFRVMPIQGVHADLDEILAMTEIPGVKSIWKDQQLDHDIHQAVVVSSTDKVWADMDFNDLNYGLPVIGRGVGVLVNDSGFDGEDTDIQSTQDNLNNTTDGVTGFFPRLVQNIKGTSNVINSWVEDSSADNDQAGGHGSHCMGIIGADGRHSNGKYVGVAPGAHLLGYGSGAGLSILNTAGGFEYIAENAKNYNIRVMSNSYGSTSDSTFQAYTVSTTSMMTRKLTNMGVIVVFSAGNSGPGNGTITGSFKTSPWVLCIGNGVKDGSLANSSSRGRLDPAGMHPSMRQEIEVDENGDLSSNGTRYLWENRPTVVAPGTDIVSVRATSSGLQGLSALDDASLSVAEIQYYTILSGTSMACPHAAGVVALMLEANPSLEWRAVKAILQRTAYAMAGNEFQQVGYGYVNAHAAVAAAFHGLLDVSAMASYEEKYGLPVDGSFGFDGEAWQVGTLHPEVAARISANGLPSAEGVEGVCGENEAPLTDATGDGGSDFYDIEEVTFHDETAEDFKISLKVAGNLGLSPTGSPNPGTRHFYDVHFTLTKPAADDGSLPNSITYIVSARDELGSKIFKQTVRTSDGTTRPSENAADYRDVTGTWNETPNTITWTVPKANLDVSAVPESGTAADRNGREAREGDVLARWEAYTYERIGTATPDGAGVYNDSATGSCFKSLMVKKPVEPEDGE